MFNFFDLDVKRAVVHEIFEKESGQPNSTINESDDLMELDETVVYTILERLSSASEKVNKTFDLMIGDSHDESFFGLGSSFKHLDDEDFIHRTKIIANKLAVAQTSSRIPGGYLVVIDANRRETDKQVSIAIKAELHDALILHEGSMRLLDHVFLSPSQKLFKFGLIYELEQEEIDERGLELDHPNSTWAALVYDDQFRIDSKPAEYFYKEFLGLSTIGNGIIQTKRFYDKTNKFIQDYYEDYETREDMLSKLHDVITDTSNETIVPKSFSNNITGTSELKKQFENEVIERLPENIENNPTLVRSNLNKKTITFPGNLRIVGPIDNMDTNIEIIKNKDDLNNLVTDHPNYTIIKVAGKPYSND